MSQRLIAQMVLLSQSDPPAFRHQSADLFALRSTTKQDAAKTAIVVLIFVVPVLEVS